MDSDDRHELFPVGAERQEIGDLGEAKGGTVTVPAGFFCGILHLGIAGIRRQDCGAVGGETAERGFWARAVSVLSLEK
jgi:hypothetical protein